MSSKLYTRLFLFFLALLIVAACSPDKFIPENQYLLEKVRVQSDAKHFDAAQMAQYVRQKGNARWFSLFRIPLSTYSMAGTDTTKWINRTLRKVGEAPVIYDTLQARLSCEDLRMAMNNMGYMNSQVTLNTKIRGKRLTAIYTLHPGEPFTISNFEYDIQDSAIARILASSLHTDSAPRRFIVSDLDAERKRITGILNDSGYYRFNKDFIFYTADSIRESRDISVTLHLKKYTEYSDAEPTPHPRYIINEVRIVDTNPSKPLLRPNILRDNILIEPQTYFSASNMKNTYNNMARLSAVRYTDIKFREQPKIDSLVIGRMFKYRESALRYLDADIQIIPNAPNTISFQPEGTNTAGNLGAAAVLTYQNRNLFHGSELLSIQLRAAFEAITGLEGYDNRNFEEYSLQTGLTFPRLLSPFLTKNFRRRSKAVSEATVSWAMQNRPEFHRRMFSAAWKYRWNTSTQKTAYNFNVLDVSYVYMPWISQTFKRDYLDNASSRNAILRYNYEDLLIMKSSLGLTYITPRLALRTQIESAGSILSSLNTVLRFPVNAQRQRMLFNIAYAQYLKFDFNITRLIPLDQRNTLALHAAFGISWPYGNSTILPFEKRYIAGGANSVRGWSVRELGPGRFKGTDGRIDFINQTGDLKLDLNAELRTRLFWKLDAAAFVDAGNIWTLRNYADQPGGQFNFSRFYRELAMSYGLGIRLNLNYFIIRLDGAQRIINPAYDSSFEHFPIINPHFKRDFRFHFAVGLPF